MRSTIMIHILFIVLSFSSAIFSHSNHKARLYDIIRKSVNKTAGTLLLEVRPHKRALSTKMTTARFVIDEQSQITEAIKLQERDSWDSEEEIYFKWAALNRRPMESLGGRKRFQDTIE